MSTPEILTFSAPQTEIPIVEAVPSPTLELAYAYYFLNRPDSRQRAGELPWLEALYTHHEKLTEEIKGFWQREKVEGEECGFDLFWMVADMGYVRDPDPERFLKDFPRLPGPFMEQVKAQQEKLKERSDKANEMEHKTYQAMLARLAVLERPEAKKRFARLLSQLWGALEPFWKEEGQAETRRASEAFLAKYRQTGNVLDALPPHHFTQFEASSQEIRASQEKGKLVVVPLFFSSAGGFNFDFADTHYIGYGIQSERHHEKLADQAREVAARVKALADPTRLLLLTLIARYEHFALTVGDLAVQLGVTQPTVSGHLKQLREAGLVDLDKHGNKSFYRVNAQALGEVIGQLDRLILRPGK
ncbi:MAG TPA: metalloregulator ArsR/SmtB family transcription factor [Meiothermus sp.]|nr:metalloregulator ArsR/SmtB family transcription factor [Meiothermus sp.]